MTAFNVVRFRTKPGREDAFIAAHETATLDAPGFRRFTLIRTGDRTFCVVGEWDDMASLAGANAIRSLLSIAFATVPIAHLTCPTKPLNTY